MIHNYGFKFGNKNETKAALKFFFDEDIFGNKKRTESFDQDD